MGVVVHDGGACGSDQCDGGGVGGGGCVVVIVFLLETGSEPQQRCDCRFTYVRLPNVCQGNTLVS